jgi:nitric oxide reductase subunit C
MSELFTKSAARNIYYGGSLFFVFVFLGLTFHTTLSAVPKRDNHDKITPAVAAGKMVWERNDCIGCHTILGEGAYFAPELGNVYKRRGGDFIKAWIQAMPTHTKGRRQMPQFNLTSEELNNLVEFLKWTSEINTEKWPPNIEG